MFYFEGDDYFQAVRSAISEARSRIDIEMYHFAEDAIGRSFADLLIAKAHDGVGVKLIYDAVGCRGTSEAFFLRMDHAGIGLKAHHPLSALLKLRGRFVRRNHRKYVIIDGKVAFLGGFNFASEYSKSESGAQAWRDTGVRLESPSLIAQFQEVFRHAWMRRAELALSYFQNYFQTRRGRGLWKVGARIVANYGWSRKHWIHRAYLTAVREAQRRIWITNSYFIPDGRLRRALRRAARRGVDVRILTAGVSDVSIARWAGQATYSRLLQSRARIFEYQNRVLHAKSAVIDADWYTVGTSNLDPLSLFKNLEVNLFATDASEASVLAGQFEMDLQVSKEIVWEEWRRRPWWMKLREMAFFWLRKWL